ncbi:MAG: hypothetical protein GF401_19240 [Chitinivibrionales bacterium]|nr:hypothetical protein [Chitinivibrionales bacterium]
MKSSKISGKCVCAAILFITTFHFHLHAQVVLNESICLFAWTRLAGDSINKGHRAKGSFTTEEKKPSDSQLKGSFSCEGISEWLGYVTSGSSAITVFIEDTLPAEIVNASRDYRNCRWIREIEARGDNDTTLVYFPFPLLDSALEYIPWQYYTVAFNDSLRLQFSCSKNNLLTGSFFNRNQKANPDRWLIGKDALRIITQNQKPFRLARVEVDGRYKELASSYLGIDLDMFAKHNGYFGIDIDEACPEEKTIARMRKPVTEPVLQCMMKPRAGSLLEITWALPERYENNTAIALYNMNGKCLWRHTAYSTPGKMQRITIPHALSAGAYIVRMEMKIDKENQEVVNRRITYVP